MSVRPSRSTLFPYTTLFRSAPSRHQLGDRGAKQSRESRYDVLHPKDNFQLLLSGIHTRRMACGPVPPVLSLRYSAHEPKSDRKSTRLNSSHMSNSYAVFCLK